MLVQEYSSEKNFASLAMVCGKHCTVSGSAERAEDSRSRMKCCGSQKDFEGNACWYTNSVLERLVCLETLVFEECLPEYIPVPPKIVWKTLGMLMENVCEDQNVCEEAEHFPGNTFENRNL